MEYIGKDSKIQSDQDRKEDPEQNRSQDISAFALIIKAIRKTA